LLTGSFKPNVKHVDVKSVIREINDAREDAIRRKYEQNEM